ncbi:MAG TPA: pyruvate kinase [Chlamydiales bacterium]|nr:pyruvate kinase [Chlamydiales bacterium]
MHTRTKIICTLGPATSSYEKIRELAEAGMDVARLNFSHGSHEEHLERIKHLRRVREELNKPLAIMVDLRGPKIRVGEMKNGGVELKAKQRLKIVEGVVGDEKQISITPIEVLDSVNVGMKLLFNDGYIISEVVEKHDREIVVEIQNSGFLSSRKGVNIPKAQLHLPALTDDDIRDLKFACKHNVELVAASFIRSAENVLWVKNLIAKEGKHDILVVAKIETHQGVENFDSIVQVADGIMVARGDMGVEMDLGEVPRLQKMMIRKCYEACKPVVTATQMLESMIQNPRPTRAEASDVANAIYDGTSSVMLSAETAMGKYPVETVQQMKSIIHATENDFNYREFFHERTKKEIHNVSAAVAAAAVKTAYSANAKAIIAFTATGLTARLVSRFRPEMPIIALTPDERCYHQLAFNWGVKPIYKKGCLNAKESFTAATEFGLEKGLVHFGDLVVITAGSLFGKKGSTNMMIVESIGDVLVRGQKGIGPKVEGKITFCLSPEEQNPESAQGALIVIPKCDNSYLPIMKHAAGVILENHTQDIASEKYALLVAKTFEISVITRAEGARETLREGDLVTLDPGRGLVYGEGDKRK